MVALEVICLCLIAALCYLCTKSDLQHGMIYNKVLVVFLFLSIIVDVVYYGVFVQDLFYEFIANVIIITAVSLYFFYSHSFAGGDCKMMIVVALLFPARLYWVLGNSNITLIFTIVFAIFAGYCYLLISSIWAIITKKVVISFDYIKDYLLNFFKSYITAILYISLFNRFFSVIYRNGFEVNVWVTSGVCLLVAWCIGRYSCFKKWFFIVPTACVVLAISIITRTLPISLNPKDYILVLVLLLCQMTIKTTIYEKVEVTQLKKGMILTTFSSMLMQTSITKGLPGISTEDLKSRLTNEEIESIKIWAKATHTESLTIVKKIPFAIFISIGILLYCSLWGILL
jgi:Flp pilus assembly protein protease CpaA